MSNILIFSTNWVGKKDTILEDNAKFIKGHNNSDAIFSQAFVQNFLFKDDSSAIADMYGLEDNENGTNKLIEVAQKLVEHELGNIDFLKEDIESQDWGNLLQDIYDSFKENRKNSVFLDILTSFMPQKQAPCCCFKQEKDNDVDYLAIGISPLCYNGAGIQFYHEWSRALIDDFTEANDNVILALHGRTDWKDFDKSYGFISDFSQQISSELNRNIQVHIFSHVGFDYIAQAINMNNSTLSNIWNYINTHAHE